MRRLYVCRLEAQDGRRRAAGQTLRELGRLDKLGRGARRVMQKRRPGARQLGRHERCVHFTKDLTQPLDRDRPRPQHARRQLGQFQHRGLDTDLTRAAVQYQ